MEELFEVIVAIVIVIAATSRSFKKTKAVRKTAPVSGKGPLPVAKKAATVARAAVESVIEELPVEAKEALSALEIPIAQTPSPAKPMPVASVVRPKSVSAMNAVRPGSAPKKPASGESITDKHGCIGGSLGAHIAEGETKEEHDQHLKEAAARRQAAAARRTAVVNARAVAREEMRRAVVWSEILDKPKALRVD